MALVGGETAERGKEKRGKKRGYVWYFYFLALWRTAMSAHDSEKSPGFINSFTKM